MPFTMANCAVDTFETRIKPNKNENTFPIQLILLLSAGVSKQK
jgi:hypothetical protein